MSGAFVFYLVTQYPSQASSREPQERDDGKKHAKQQSEIAGIGNVILILLRFLFFQLSTGSYFPSATVHKAPKNTKMYSDQTEGSF